MKASQIHRTTIAGLFGVLLLPIITAGQTRAAATASNQVSFTELWTDKLVCTRDPDMGDWSCVTFDSDRITVSARISGVFTGLTVDTSFDLFFGDTDLAGFLGQDSKYKPGKSTSATIVERDTDPITGKDVVVCTAKLKWTPKQVTITITGKLLNVEAIAAGNYDGQDSQKINETVSGYLTFGGAYVTFDKVSITGTVKTKTTHAKDGSDYPLSTISLHGSGTE